MACFEDICSQTSKGAKNEIKVLRICHSFVCYRSQFLVQRFHVEPLSLGQKSFEIRHNLSEKLYSASASASCSDFCRFLLRLQLVVTELENVLDEARSKSDENKDTNADDNAAASRRTTKASSSSSQRSTISSQRSTSAKGEKIFACYVYAIWCMRFACVSLSRLN